MPHDGCILLAEVSELFIDKGNVLFDVFQVHADDLEFVALDPDEFVAMYTVKDLFRGRLCMSMDKRKDLFIYDLILWRVDQVIHDPGG